MQQGTRITALATALGIVASSLLAGCHRQRTVIYPTGSSVDPWAAQPPPSSSPPLEQRSWQSVGPRYLSDGPADYIELFVRGETPYVFFVDQVGYQTGLDAAGKSYRIEGHAHVKAIRLDDQQWQALAPPRRSDFFTTTAGFVEHDGHFYMSTWNYVYRLEANQWRQVLGPIFTEDEQPDFLRYPLTEFLVVADGDFHALLYKGAEMSAKRHVGNNRWEWEGRQNFEDLSYNPTYASDGTTTYVVYVERPHGPTDQSMVRVAKYEGGDWKLLDGNAWPQGRLVTRHLAIAFQEQVPYFAFHDVRTQLMQVRRYVQGRWENVGAPLASEQQPSPHLAFDRNGVLHIAYTYSALDDSAVVVQRLMGGQWQKVGFTRKRPSGSQAQNIRLAFAADNTPIMAWSSGDTHQLTVMTLR